MVMKMSSIVASAAGTLLLAACGGADTPAGNQTASQSAAAAGGMPSNWKATDACTVLDKAAIGAALGTEVTEATLSLVHEPDGATAGTSECTYMLKDGGRASLMTRWSPIDDNTPAAMKAARDTLATTLKAFTSKPIEDVAGLGAAAFWVPGINQLNVFIGADRFVILTIGSAPADKAKDIAIALARKAGA